MNRLENLFNKKRKNILNIYFTAGHPQLNDTVEIALELEKSGADLIEIGIPYSDPLADGETIQNSSSKALSNGINIKTIFDQIETIRSSSEIPIIAMGYLNQCLQYGLEDFLKKAHDVGVDGLILPDMPLDYYEQKYQSIFEKYNIKIAFLITPKTSDVRIKQADRLSNAFLYVVSKSATTGKSEDLTENQKAYFKKVNDLKLSNPKLIGFGIHDKKSFDNACKFAEGAIIGSAMIRNLEQNGIEGIHNFMASIKN